VDRDELVELAETIRPELPMLAPDAVGQLDRLLDQLRSGEPVNDDVFELLTSTAPLRQRVNEILPADEDVEKGGANYGFQEMPGHGEPVGATIYGCPHGDYRYPVLEVGEPIPVCPSHKVPLVAW
jgi:hypothetical protein